MNTIKFNNTRSGFTKELRRNVNEYFREKGISTKGNNSMVYKAIVMYTLFLVPLILMLIFSFPNWMIFPLSILMGLGMAGLGMAVMHDAMHESLSRHKWMNKLFGNTMYLLGGNVFTWKVQHNIMHHTFTNVEGHDEDINSRGIFRFTPGAPLRKYHRFQHIYIFPFYCMMTLSKLVSDFIQLRNYNKAGITEKLQSKPSKENTKIILTKILYLAVFLGLPIIFSSFPVWMIIIGFFIMHFTAGLIMSVIFQLAHLVEGTTVPQPNEEGKIENDWMIHELETTANFARNNRFLGWFIGGLNFQIEHHLFPNISHVHYRHISPIVERTAKEFGLNYNLQPTFRHALVSHLRLLKRMGRYSS